MKEDNRISLFSVVVRDAVQYKTAVDNTLLCSDGELQFDTKLRVVLAKANSIFKREALIIPLENVKCMVELTDRHVKLLVEKAAAKAAPAAPEPEPVGKSDRVKFVKDEFGKIVEVKA